MGQVGPESTGGVRLSELVAGLSLVADLGLGQPMEHLLRQTIIAMRLADWADYGADQQEASYYTSLLAWVGCAADTHDLAALFGDEHKLYRGGYEVDFAGAAAAGFLLRLLGSGRPTIPRLTMVGQFFATGGRALSRALNQHCLATGDLADRLGLGDSVRRPLLQAFERWDGRGTPSGIAGDALDPAIRIVQLADTVEEFHRTSGPDAVRAVATRRRGTKFDPTLVDVLLEHLDDVVADLGELNSWGAVIDLDPALGRGLSDDELDTALAAVGDFSDLKCPARTGHSRAVATLAAAAGARLGLPPGDVRLLRRAGWVHDVGMIGVPSAIWDQPGPWSVSQREHARTHPYLTQRMLAGSPELASIGQCASMHHERLDGSGYPSGLGGDQLSMPARLLAVADVYEAMVHDRPHRTALPAADARRALRAEVRAGHLDGDAVDAVVAATGHRVRRRPELPGGLTRREAEVVVLLARGLSNPGIATELSISRKTVSSHLEHVYTKLGVSSRTQAALFAMANGLVGSVSPS